jgi:hypothetical protein
MIRHTYDIYIIGYNDIMIEWSINNMDMQGLYATNNDRDKMGMNIYIYNGIRIHGIYIYIHIFWIIHDNTLSRPHVLNGILE